MTASEEKFTRQTLLDVQTLTPSLFTLRTTRDAGFRFRAGQFARLGVYKPSGSIVWRAYSMVSAPHDEHLEFFSIVVPGGEFTSELSRLREGDQLLVVATESALEAAERRLRAVDRAGPLARWRGVGRNDPCPCGSGRKAKYCCWSKRQ